MKKNTKALSESLHSKTLHHVFIKCDGEHAQYALVTCLDSIECTVVP